MKRLVPVFILILTIPQIAMAAWWSPSSWNIFHKKVDNTKLLEKRISELESRLNALSAVTLAQATTTLVASKVATSTASSTVSTTTPAKPRPPSPQLSLAGCLALVDEERLLTSHLNASITYFQTDVEGLLQDALDYVDYKSRYSYFANTRDFFFKSLEQVKSVDAQRIKSVYLDPKFTQSIVSSILNYANGYQNMWDTLKEDSLELGSFNSSDGIEKLLAIDLLKKDSTLRKANLELINKIIALKALLPAKYTALKIKYGCL